MKYVLILSLALSVYAEVSNSCEDSLYIELKKKDINELTDREYEYFKILTQKCHEDKSSQVKSEQNKSNLGFLNEGKLDQNWFSDNKLSWEKKKYGDFFWINSNYKFTGKKYYVEWEEPIIDEGSDEWDKRISNELVSYMPMIIETSLSKYGIKSKDNKGLKIIGKTVDCNVCTSLMSMALEVQTFSVKIIDPTSGELLMGIHHSTLNGWVGRGKGIKRDARQWAEKFTRFLSGL